MAWRTFSAAAGNYIWESHSQIDVNLFFCASSTVSSGGNVVLLLFRLDWMFAFASWKGFAAQGSPATVRICSWRFAGVLTALAYCGGPIIILLSFIIICDLSFYLPLIPAQILAFALRQVETLTFTVVFFDIIQKLLSPVFFIGKLNPKFVLVSKITV